MAKYIKKISLATVESYICKDIRTNSISIGFDVAEHSTGIAVIRTTDSYLILELTHKLEVPKKLKELDALDLFLSQLDNFKDQMSRRFKFDEAQIENCFLKFNVATLKMLARCSGFVYDRFRHLSKNSELIMPVSARSRVSFKKSGKSIKGKKLKQEIMDYVNEMLEIDIDDHDIADGIVLALSGLILEDY